jgi:ArsR family transcriptional regulator, virulence genes transcriptional regulator
MIGESAPAEPARLNYTETKNAAKILWAINHKLSQKILKLLEEHKRLHVLDIYVKLRLQQSVTSKCLSFLRQANVVCTERDGRRVYYVLNNKRIAEIDSLVHGLLSDPDADVK